MKWFFGLLRPNRRGKKGSKALYIFIWSTINGARARFSTFNALEESAFHSFIAFPNASNFIMRHLPWRLVFSFRAFPADAYFHGRILLLRLFSFRAFS